MTGKKSLLLILAGVFPLMGMLFYFKGIEAWRIWNLPVMIPSFADVRNILAGIQAHQLGFDPLYQNPFDPFGRVMVYPRLWFSLGVFKLNQEDAPLLAAIEIILFLIGLFLFLDRYDSLTAWLIITILISPAAMLCFERGNFDLLIFFILAFALSMAPLSQLLCIILIDLAAVLKLYPIVGLGYLVRAKGKTSIAFFLGGFAIFAVYVAVTWRDIIQILSMAPKAADFNYGVTVPGLWLLEITKSRPLTNVVIAFSYATVYILIVFLLFVAGQDATGVLSINPRSLDAFRIGALIYIGTFLQGNTWNYRLIFLIFTSPQLLDWARTQNIRIKQISRINLVCSLASCWIMILPANGQGVNALGTIKFLFSELANWGLLAGLIYLLFASFPKWLHEEVQRFCGRFLGQPIVAGN